MTDRQPDICVAIRISDAGGDISDGPGGVRQRALEVCERPDFGIAPRQRLLAKWLRQDEAADAEIVELRTGGVGVRDQIAAERHVEREVDGTLVRGAAIFGERVARTDSAGTLREIRVSITLTTPPIAEEPNKSAEGPRKTSIRSAVSGLIVTWWSGSDEDRSSVPIPSTRMRTRSPDRPRRIGREAVGPKLEAVTPGWLARVSPMLGRAAR